MAIAKIRRLLLETLDNMTTGKPLPGLNPASFRVRSTTHCEMPRDAAVADVMPKLVRVEPPLAAQ
jgi:hypothetical protein